MPTDLQVEVRELTANNLAHIEELGNEVTFYLELDGENYHTAAPVAFVIGNAAHGYFASRDIELLYQKTPLNAVLTDEKVVKNVFNAKAVIVALKRLDVALNNIGFDLLLVAYLLDTNDNNNDLGALAQQNDYYAVQTDEEVYGKGAKFAIPEVDADLFEHLARKAMAITNLKDPLMAKLTAHAQLDLYTDIERPLSMVLAEMEATGITVDANHLLEMRSKFAERLSELEQQIYNQAGEEFNINSPKQLGIILFEKMGLKPIKKDKDRLFNSGGGPRTAVWCTGCGVNSTLSDVG